MNWDKFKKNIGWRFQLAPTARSITPDGIELAVPDFDDWILLSIERDEAAHLQRIASGHVAKLGKDHLYDFRSDPSRRTGGLSFGFLVLKMQVVIVGNDVRYVPNARPGEAADYRLPSQAELARRKALLKRLRQLYRMEHDGLSSEMILGFAPLPKEWTEQKLAELGELWRQDTYY